MNEHNPFSNLPCGPTAWQAIVEPAKDAYWKARRENKTETEALLTALNKYAELFRKFEP